MMIGIVRGGCEVATGGRAHGRSLMSEATMVGEEACDSSSLIVGIGLLLFGMEGEGRVVRGTVTSW